MWALEKKTILNKKIIFYQPQKGYRLSIDPFLLAACVHAQDHQKILDIGTGSGAVALILSHENITYQLTGIECDDMLISCAYMNAKANHNVCIQWVHADIQEDQSISDHFFDHVVSNPPFYDPYHYRQSVLKKNAHMEKVSLQKWLIYAVKKLVNGGILHLIHIPERLPEILKILHHLNCSVTLFPLWPKKNTSCHRILLKAKKNSRAHFQIKEGLILHQDNGEFTPMMEKILKGEEKIFF